MYNVPTDESESEQESSHNSPSAAEMQRYDRLMHSLPSSSGKIVLQCISDTQRRAGSRLGGQGIDLGIRKLLTSTLSDTPLPPLDAFFLCHQTGLLVDCSNDRLTRDLSYIDTSCLLAKLIVLPNCFSTNSYVFAKQFLRRK